MLDGAIHVTVDIDAVAVRKRGKKEGVEFDVLEAVRAKVQLLNDGSEANEDMSAPTQIKLISWDDLLGGDRAPYDVSLLKYPHAVAGLRQVSRCYQAIVPGANYTNVKIHNYSSLIMR